MGTNLLKESHKCLVNINALCSLFLQTCLNYLTIIDCLYLIKYVLQTSVLRSVSFFMKEKVNFIVETVMEI